MKKSENILLLGLGSLGYYLAKRLTQDGHNVTAIERNHKLIAQAKEDLDARLINGDINDSRTWEKAAPSEMDYVLAMTNNDALNIVAAVMAEHYGIPQRIVRTRTINIWSEHAILKAQDFNVNLIIRPEELTAQEMVRLLEMRTGSIKIDFGEGELAVVVLNVVANTELDKKNIRDLATQYSEFPFQVVSVGRDIDTYIPDGNFTLRANDHVYVLLNSINIPLLAKLAGLSERQKGRVLIVGGGRTGSRVAELIEDSYKVRLLESNEQKAEELHHVLKRTECLHGDGSDRSTLIQAGLLNTDTVITTTGDSETNIMSAVLAKHLIQTRSGDRHDARVIAHVQRAEYLTLASALGTDLAVSEKVLVANQILRYIRRGHVLSVAHLHGCDAEMVELIADTNSPITRCTIAELPGLKDRIVIGAVYQGGQWTIARGHMRINKGDRVVCICDDEHLGELQELFMN